MWLALCAKSQKPPPLISWTVHTFSAACASFLYTPRLIIQILDVCGAVTTLMSICSALQWLRPFRTVTIPSLDILYTLLPRLLCTQEVQDACVGVWIISSKLCVIYTWVEGGRREGGKERSTPWKTHTVTPLKTIRRGGKGQRGKEWIATTTSSDKAEC